MKLIVAALLALCALAGAAGCGKGSPGGAGSPSEARAVLGAAGFRCKVPIDKLDPPGTTVRSQLHCEHGEESVEMYFYEGSDRGLRKTFDFQCNLMREAFDRISGQGWWATAAEVGLDGPTGFDEREVPSLTRKVVRILGGEVIPWDC